MATKTILEKLRVLVLRAPTNAQNSVANQTKLLRASKNANPSIQTPLMKREIWKPRTENYEGSCPLCRRVGLIAPLS